MSLPTIYQQYIHKSNYSRWMDEEGRREEYEETTERYIRFIETHLLEQMDFKLSKSVMGDLRTAINRQDVMPSMRAMMTAGPALARCATVGYNCSYIAVNKVQAFDEILYLLMGGSGVGFSCESKHVNKLPDVPATFTTGEDTIVVEDDRAGWAQAFRYMIKLLYAGKIPEFDFSKVRPRGAKLKTMGGRASGPDPLRALFEYSITLFRKASGRKLNTLEVHDLVCMIGDVIVSGGVRRSALISLSDLQDDRMRMAKSGQWYSDTPFRMNANNSAVYDGAKPDIGSFMREWLSLYDSKSGERGIFNRQAAKEKAKANGRRQWDIDWGTNPCGEILLRSSGFCNLTEAVVRSADTLADLERKVKLATILGTFQSTLIHFKHVSKEWTRNAEQERLLGVSLTGIMDNTLMSGREGSEKLNKALGYLKEVAIETNKVWAGKLGINRAAAITCLKPSGTVSQLVDSASGIHPRFSQYYIRTVRGDKTSPVARMMVDAGFIHEDDLRKPDHQWVFSFPQKAPEGAVLRSELTAIQHLEIWKSYQEHWCEHNPSVTINIRENEWLDVGGWVYNHLDKICGVAFLPYSDHVYEQAPYQECDEQTYNELLAKCPKEVDWSLLSKYETEDETTTNREFACTGDKCELK